MSIEKKSLISTLKATKKANVVSSAPSPEAIHKMNKAVPKVVLKVPAKAYPKVAVVKSLKKTLKSKMD